MLFATGAVSGGAVYMGMGWCSYCCKLYAWVVLQRAYAVAVGAVRRGVTCMCTIVQLLPEAGVVLQRTYDVAVVSCGAAYLFCCC